MKNKKKILFLNGGVKKFGNDFRKACEDLDIECVSARAHHNSFLIAETTGCRYFHLGEEIDFKNINYCFIRVKTKFSHMNSLISNILKSRGTPFNDLGNLEHTKSDEKITQMVRFAEAGIPIPRSVIFSRVSYKKNKEAIQEHISYPCVLKTNGSKGEAVWKIESQEELEKKIKDVKEDLMFTQDFVENDYDIRALIYDNELLGAIERYSNDDFYNNVTKGGSAKPAEITPEELELSKKAMRVLGLNFGGVDFIRTDDGIVFFEINKGPMVYGLEETLDKTIPAEIVKVIDKNYLKS
jgi:RimK family alpha-L-glutamate ligase